MSMIVIAFDKVNSSVQLGGLGAPCSSKAGNCSGRALSARGLGEVPRGWIRMDEISGRFGSCSGSERSSCSDSRGGAGTELPGIRHRRSSAGRIELAGMGGFVPPFSGVAGGAGGEGASVGSSATESGSAGSNGNGVSPSGTGAGLSGGPVGDGSSPDGGCGTTGCATASGEGGSSFFGGTGRGGAR